MSAFPTYRNPLPLPPNTGPQMKDLFTAEEIKKYATNPDLLYYEYQKRLQAYYDNMYPPQTQQKMEGPQIGGITQTEMTRGESEYKRKQQQLANNTNADPIAARVAFGPSAPMSDYLGGGVGGGLLDSLALVSPGKFSSLGMLPGKTGKIGKEVGKYLDLPNELVGMAAQRATGMAALPLVGRVVGRTAQNIYKEGFGKSATDQFLTGIATRE